MELKYERKIGALFVQDEHLWMKWLSPEEVKALKEVYLERYD